MSTVPLDDVVVQIQKAGDNQGDEEVQAETKKLVKDFRKQEEAEYKEEISDALAEAKAKGADEDELEKIEKDTKKEIKGKRADVTDQLKDAVENADLEPKQVGL